MNRPAVNVNFHHLVDLLGEGPDGVLPVLDQRFGLPVEVLDAAAALREVSLGREHLVAVGNTHGSMLQSFLAELACQDSGSFVDVNGNLQPAFTPGHGALLERFGDFLRTESRAPSTARARVDVTDVGGPFDLALFGDWGTGTPGAARVAASIAASGCAVRVHLGDVYYSGTATETAAYLVDRWPGTGAELSRACNSNHEMYSGGGSYHGLTLPFLGQTSPVFVIRSDNWLFVGLDTGSVDGRVPADQVRAVLEVVEADVRDVVLLSHHPWSSWNTAAGKLLRDDLEPVLRTGRVRAWYSAHDHGFVRYDPEPEFGIHVICAGHGGFPYVNVPTKGDVTSSSGSLRLEALAPAVAGVGGVGLFGPSGLGHRPEDYGPLGWVRLEVSGPELTEHVVDADGGRHFPRQIRSHDGGGCG